LQLYYITDRKQLGPDEPSRRASLLKKIAEAAAAGVDFIQLRERDLLPRELEQLAAEALKVVRGARSRTKLLINSRVDVALAAGADGVHLRSDDIAASEVRAVWAKSSGKTNCVIGVSCHSLGEVLSAEGHGADFVVFGPVFGKQGSAEPAVGVQELSRVSRRAGTVDARLEAGQGLTMPVFALGGVTEANACQCIASGAAGIAGIRMFQEDNVAETIRRVSSGTSR
jgi:thiamine-phosphate pyrophosphorylase